MKPDYSKYSVIISSAMTGEIIGVIKMNRLLSETISEMVRDYFYDDLINNKEGLLIKYGING